MDNNERNHHLWKALDQLRATDISFSDAQSVAVALIDQGEELTWRDYDLLLQQLGLFARGSGSPRFNPRYKPTNQITLETIRHFVGETLKPSTIDTVFEPWNSGLPLMHALIDTGLAAKGVGYTPNQQTAELLSNLSHNKPIEWHCASYLHAPEIINQQADLIVCFPPWNVRKKQSWTDPADGTSITDEDAHILLINMGEHLAENGLAIFALPNFFFFSQRKGCVRDNLYRAGLSVEAAINIPNMSAYLGTAIPFNLVFVRKTSDTDDSYFVGQLSASPERNSVLAKNLVARTRGESSELGKLISKAEFTGFSAVQAEERFSKLSAPYQSYPKVSLADISFKILHGRDKTDFEFQHDSNSIYVPMHLNGQVVTDPTEMRSAKNCLQVNLDLGKAYPQYVANYLNTELGRHAREMFSPGAMLPHLLKAGASKLPIYLPKLAEQLELTQTDLSIQSLISELTQLQRQLTEQPKALPTIQKKLDTYSNPQADEEKFTEWLETLPFPLASILWTYHTADRDKDRYEHLLHFFEASTQFMATLMLSAVEQNPAFAGAIKDTIRTSQKNQQLSLERATFGTWVSIYSTIAKAIRIKWNDNNESEKNECIHMFATDRDKTFGLITSKKLVEIFSKANEMRNAWTGHGGVVSEKDAISRHEQLVLLLQKMKIETGNVWSNYELIQAKSMTLRKGVYRSQIQRIMGTRTPFENTNIETDHGLEAQLLYFFDNDQNQALPLLPLIRLSSSPKEAQNACYFYNRKQKDGIKFVSYHFKDETSQVGEFSDTLELLNTIGL